MPSLRITFVTILVGTIAPAFANVNIAGCYNSYGDAQNFGPNTYQTQGLCETQCLNAGQAVWAVTKGSTCFCGQAVPSSGEVDMSECNVTCQGYGQSCGGEATWLFGYTGLLPSSIPGPSSTASSTTASSTTPSTTTSAVQTTVVIQSSPATVTAAPEGQSSNSGSSSSASKAGIAAGVIVSVVAIIGIGVGGYLVVRRNRRLQAEEEYRAAVAAKEFTASIRKPASDSRLDPVILQHRLSDGSIADNQDFSRRILKVTNPDA